MTFERRNIAAMRGYLPGEQPGGDDVIKLNTNENPYPPAPALREVLQNVDIDALRRYPDPLSTGFRGTAAEVHGVSPSQVIATRGGDELLRLVITTYVNPGATIGMTNPTYSLYRTLAQIQDCPVFEVPLGDDWMPPADLADRMNAAEARLLLMVNPHAPSGTLLGTDYIDDLCARFDGLVLLDEAYIDFVEEDAGYESIPLIDTHRNLIILRTLSKGYSIAGMRLGYGIGRDDIIQPMMEKTRDSYNLDAISQALAEAALGDQAYASETWRRVREERSRLRDALAAMSIETTPSQTNFLLATIEGEPGAADVYQRLKESGVLVRYFPEERLRNRLRITVGTPDENDRLITLLAEIRQHM